MAGDATYDQRMADAIRSCAMELSNVARDMRDSYEELQARVMVADRDNAMLKDQVKIAQRQLTDILDEGAKKDQTIARLSARLQLGREIFDDNERGAEIMERQAKGAPAFPPHPGPSEEAVSLLGRLTRRARHEAANLAGPRIDLDKMERDMKARP